MGVIWSIVKAAIVENWPIFTIFQATTTSCVATTTSGVATTSRVQLLLYYSGVLLLATRATTASTG